MIPPRPRRQEFGTRRNENEHTHRSDAIDHPGDQLLGGRINPVRIFQDNQNRLLLGQLAQLMHDRGNRRGFALWGCELERRITVIERYREKIGEKTPCCVGKIIGRTKERFQLLQLDRSRILDRKAGGPLKLTDDRMERAVCVIRRALEDQMVVGIVSDSLPQSINRP